MAVGDVITSVVVIGLIFLFVRWMSKSASPTTSDGSIRGVTRQMVETVHAAFPDIPPSNIIYSLSKTRSAQATSEEILERGFLPAPPASFTVPTSLLPPSSVPASTSAIGKARSTVKPQQSLIDKYGLTSRLPSRKGKEKDEAGTGSSVISEETEAPGTGGSETPKWEASKEQREMTLKERKEKMILEARRRMLEKQEKEKAATEVPAST